MSTIDSRVGRIVLCLLAALTLAACAQARPGGVAAPASHPSGDPVIAAVGDIACDPQNSAFHDGSGAANACRQRYVGDLVSPQRVTAVLALGDLQYYCGSTAAFDQSYDRAWGRLKPITYPVVGNHEYLTDGGKGTEGATGCDAGNGGAAGYFAYFGARAGTPSQGWYSFDVGRWHLIALNSSCAQVGGCDPASAQARWLAGDLAAHPGECTLAFWHIPLFSSGGRASTNMGSIWDQLYRAGVELVLTGHDHTYERFTGQRADATRDDQFGIREFVVGTGGANHTKLGTVARNSEVADATSFGVLELTLHNGSYDWRFVPERADGFTDAGSASCHGAPSGG